MFLGLRSCRLRRRRSFRRKSHRFIEVPSMLEALVELSEHAAEEAALGCNAPVQVVVAPPPAVVRVRIIHPSRSEP
jgi:hypothetical protein